MSGVFRLYESKGQDWRSQNGLKAKPVWALRPASIKNMKQKLATHGHFYYKASKNKINPYITKLLLLMLIFFTFAINFCNYNFI